MKNHCHRSKYYPIVLSGGACVAIDAKRKYVSMDLDLINVDFVRRRILRDAMQELGFIEENRYFKHLDTAYFVEFPRGPLAIGNEPAKEIVEKSFETGMVRLLSPTDCIIA